MRIRNNFSSTLASPGLTFEFTATLEGAAVMVSALSGMLKAAEKKMDIVGTYCMALLVAICGGTVRDVIIKRRPILMVEQCGMFCFSEGLFSGWNTTIILLWS